MNNYQNLGVQDLFAEYEKLIASIEDEPSDEISRKVFLTGVSGYDTISIEKNTECRINSYDFGSSKGVRK